MKKSNRNTNNAVRNYYFLFGLIVLLVIFTFFTEKRTDSLVRELMQKNYEIEQQRIELETKKTEYAIIDDYRNVTLSDIQSRRKDINLCVEPYVPLIRDTAVTVVADAPAAGLNDEQAWQICKIYQWVVTNIRPVIDPKDFDYFALASETMLIKAGDCEDYAILLASMYEAIGMDAILVFIDTDNDKISDHLTCAVYYSKDKWDFMHEEKRIIQELQINIPAGLAYELFFEAEGWQYSGKYSEGTWILVDPIKGSVPGYVFWENYDIMELVDAGN